MKESIKIILIILASQCVFWPVYLLLKSLDIGHDMSVIVSILSTPIIGIVIFTLIGARRLKKIERLLS